MPNIEKRVSALEQAASATDSRQIVVLLFGSETEAQALERCGHSPDAEAFFIKLVPLQPRPMGENHAKS